jgi:hypothetical protein
MRVVVCIIMQEMVRCHAARQCDVALAASQACETNTTREILFLLSKVSNLSQIRIHRYGTSHSYLGTFTQ